MTMKYQKGLWFRLIERLQRSGATLVRCECGSSLVEFAMVLPLLLLLVLGAIDFGRAYYLSIEVANAARAGVQYGVRNSSDTAGMQTAAESDAPDVPNMTATSAVGCECADGSNSMSPCSSPPTCVGNPVGFVEVTTNATYTPVIPWPGVPVSIPMNGQAKMRTEQ
jgi:Flp pilus assembly protein TadG